MQKLATTPRDGYAKFYTISLRKTSRGLKSAKRQSFGLNRSLRITFNTTSSCLHEGRFDGNGSLTKESIKRKHLSFRHTFKHGRFL
jgi:hypothetical protein